MAIISLQNGEQSQIFIFVLENIVTKHLKFLGNAF